MIKHIVKHTLLFGIFALLSSMPLQAITSTPAGVKKKVETKKGLFAGWTKNALNLRMKNAMKELDTVWKPFMKCVTIGGKDCGKETRTVRRILGTILAIVAVGGAAALGQRLRQGKKAPEPVETWTPPFAKEETVEEELTAPGTVAEKKGRLDQSLIQYAGQLAANPSNAHAQDGMTRVLGTGGRADVWDLIKEKQAESFSLNALQKALSLLRPDSIYRMPIQELIKIKQPEIKGVPMQEEGPVGF